MSTGIPRPRTASFSLHISTLGSASAAHTAVSSVSPLSSPTNLGRVPLDARVVLSRRRTGYVHYIGKLKNEAGEWYGVALDEAKGDHDGSWLGERHFECAPSHGVFVRRKEIFYVKEQPSHLKNPPSPVMNDSSEDGTSGSSSNASVASLDSAEAQPLSVGLAAASPTMSPLQRTFKSFRRALQSPMKLGETIMGAVNPLTVPPSATKAMETTPTRRTASRASMIPPPAIASPKNTSSTPSRHQSFAFQPSHDRSHPPPPSPSVTTPSKPVDEQRTVSASLFGDDEFAAMTRALAEPNNPVPSAPTQLSQVPQLPPQIDKHESSAASTSREVSPSSSPIRRQSVDRRHSTFAFGTPTVSAVTLTAATNAARVVELEKEIVTMRTNHENVVAVLRATNKQHAANVLELRAQVSALADGTNWLQKQLGTKSSQLQELKHSERLADAESETMQAELRARDQKIHDLEQEISVLQTRMDSMQHENDSVLVQMQKEFQAKQKRDREQIKRLREDVVSLCNARSALQSELRDANEMSYLF